MLRPKDERGRRTVFRPEEEYKCFSTSEYVIIGIIINDGRWLYDMKLKLELKLELKNNEVANLEQQIESLNYSLGVVKTGFKEVGGLFDMEQKRTLNLSKKMQAEIWAWRGATIVLGLATAALGALYGVERYR